MSKLAQRFRKNRRAEIRWLLAFIFILAVAFALLWLLPPGAMRPWIGGLLGGLIGGGSGLAVFEAINVYSSWQASRTGKSQPKYLRKLGYGLAFAERKDMEMCEDMAAMGYVLCSVSSLGFYKFERAQPEELSYSVDYVQIKKNSEEFNRYIEIFESGGWTYVCGCDKMHWFRAPRGTTPIYTDNADLAQKYVKMRNLSVWCTVGGGLMAAAAFALTSLLGPFPSWADLLIRIAGGASGGVALAMSVGALLNHLRVLRLRGSA